MLINSSNLESLRVGFKTSFQGGLGQASSQYMRITTVVPAATKEQKYGWLGKIPNVREWIGQRAVQHLMQHDYAIKEKALELTGAFGGSTQAVAAGRLVISEALLPETDYEVRARLIVDGPTVWTDWELVTTPEVDLAGDLDGQIDASWITIGKLSVDRIRVDGLLTVEQGGALYYGKPAPSDPADGIYFGVADAGGVPTFGFAASRTAADKRQSIMITQESGLRIRNARFGVTGNTLPTSVVLEGITVKVALPAGTRQVDIEAIAGGGGGGASGADTAGAANAGSPGSATIFRLWDGTTLKHEWTVSGGGAGMGRRLDGARQGVQAASNFLGTAGLAGQGGSHDYQNVRDNTLYHNIATAAAASTGYSVGGSAGSGTPSSTNGGLAGEAGAILTPGVIDVSTWAAPAYEVVSVGEGGAGGVRTVQTACSHNYPRGGAGAAGRPGVIRLSHSAVQEIPADVVPLIPTAVGSFVKGNNLAGSFPNLGAGLWIIDTGVARAIMNLTALVISPGHTIELFNAQEGTFISSHTPTYPASPNARTIFYRFYSMGSWG